MTKYYRAKKVNNSYQLTDKLFQLNILNKTYDRIKFSENYIFCYEKDKTIIYDKLLNKTLYDNLRVGYDTLGSIQCLIDNKIQWLDYKGIFHDTFPNPKWALTGSINSTHRNIFRENNFIFESYDTGGLVDRVRRDSIVLSKSDEIESIFYLNNSTKHSYNDYSDLKAVFSFPYSYYLINSNNEQKLVSIKNKRDSIEQVLNYSQDNIMSNQAQKDSIKSLIMNLKDDIEIETIFEGDLESFGYNHPIKFKVGNLFGYYPQNKTAKYKNIDKFNFHFAKFELENGKTGWLDIYGNEYYKKE